MNLPIFILGALSLCACATSPNLVPSVPESPASLLSTVTPGDGIGREEAISIARAYGVACHNHTAFHVETNAELVGELWYINVAVGDIAPIPSADRISVNTRTGELRFRETTFPHYGALLNGCGKSQANQPLHHDASGGLTAAVVAGERRRYKAQL